MKHPSIISIDLGSAYTKVGIRRGWNGRATVVQGLPIALAEEETYCIPSVVARVRRARSDRWLIGVDAASQIPGDGVRIYRNWKAALFRSSQLAGSSNGAAVGHDEAVEVAAQFLRLLREVLLERESSRIGQMPVRIAIPKFDDAMVPVDLVCDIVREAGWSRASCRPTVYEPESNAIGFLSRGRNETWMPPRRSHRPPPVRSLRMQQMLEPGLSKAFRNMHERYVVLVTDVGAFTTDFGLVDIDTSLRNDDWNLPNVLQESVELGIRQLDERVLALLRPAVRRYFEEQPAAEWERRKRELYAGRPQKVTIGGQSVMIGAASEGDAIKNEIRDFAKRVSDARKQFCESKGLSTIHEEAVTGGGSAIQALRESLVTSIARDRRRVHDLWDPQEPLKATEAGAGVMTAHEQDRRRRENRALVRSASALGGASVFFE